MFGHRPDETAADLLRLAGCGADLVEARDGRSTVGTAILGPSGCSYDLLALVWVAVAPHARGCGLGTAILGRVQGLLDGYGKHAAFTTGAPRFYERAGFGRLAGEMGPGRFLFLAAPSGQNPGPATV